MITEDYFLCPITMNVMKDPVVSNCGHTYEKEAIEAWMQSKEICPICKKIITNVSPNFALKAIINVKFKN